MTPLAKLVLFVVLSAAPHPAAAEAPVWSQFRSTALHTGASLSALGPALAPTDSWSHASADGTPVVSSPAVAADGTVVYVEQSGLVVALAPGGAGAPLSRKVAWTFEMGTAATVAAASSPAISPAGDVVYVSAGTFQCAIFMANGVQKSCIDVAAQGFSAFTQSPAVSASYLAAPVQTGMLGWSIATSTQAFLPSYAPTSGATIIEDDPAYGVCLFYVGTGNAVKWCPQSSPSAATWASVLGEPSNIAPVVVSSLNAVFFLTSGPQGFVHSFVATGTGTVATQYCASTGTLGTSFAGAPAWVGGLFGLAAISSTSSASALMLTGPGPLACTLNQTLGGSTSSGSSLAIDAAGVAYYGTASGLLVAFDLASSPPAVLWTSPLLGGSVGVTSSPAIGPSTNVVVGTVDENGAGYVVSLLFLPVCGAGSFLLPNNTCAVCPAGTYQANATAPVFACTFCPAGSFSAANSTSLFGCLPCAAGSASNGSGQPCLPCLAGSYATGGNANCTLCDPGTFSTTSNATSPDFCLPCAPGNVAPRAGSTFCSGCGQGSYAPSGPGDCTLCPAGTASDSFNATFADCVACDPGNVAPIAGSTFCTGCGQGSYAPVGPANCTQCPPGTASDTINATIADCLPCAPGTVAPKAGTTFCAGCGQGSYAPSGPGNCTLCPAGTASDTFNATVADCLPCAPGSAANSSGSVSCVGCLAGTFAPGGATTCSADLQACYTPAGASADCSAALPYAQFGADTTHGSLLAYPGPEALPDLRKITVYSGQSSLPVSGIAVGPSGGVVAGEPFDALFFLGMSDDVFGVSSVNEGIVNNYELPTATVSFPGSPAVAPWGSVYLVGSDFRLYAFACLQNGAPLFVFTPSQGTPSNGLYSVAAPAVHSANRAVYYNAGAAGVVAVDGVTGRQLWAFTPAPAAACSTTPAVDLAGERLFVGCDDYYLYALSAKNGSMLWAYRAAGMMRSSPALSADGSGLVFTSSLGNNLLALSVGSGALAWLPAAVSAAPVFAAPAVAAGGAVIVGVADGTLFAVTSAGVQWQTALDGPILATATLGSNGTAYVGTVAGSLYAVSATTGAVRWRLSIGEPVTTPAVLLARGDTLLLPSNSSSAIYKVVGLAATATPSASATASASASASATASASASASASATASPTASASATATATVVLFVSDTATMSATATSTATSTQTATSTSSSTATESAGASASSSNSPSSSATASSSSSATATSSRASSPAGGSNSAAALALDATSTIILSAAVPTVVLALLLGAAYGRGLFRRGGGSGATSGAVGGGPADWGMGVASVGGLPGPGGSGGGGGGGAAAAPLLGAMRR